MAQQKVQFIVEAVDKASQTLKNVEQSVSKTAKNWVDKNEALVGASNAFALGLAGAATAGGFFVKSMVDEAAAAEQTKVAFTTMTGSAANADKLIKEMVGFAAKTPFELKGLENETKKLLAYGFSQTEVLGELKKMGDIAAGVGMDKLPQLTLAYGQVKAAGKLTGAELRQFTEAGVPMLEELAKVTGISMKDMGDAISDGAIGFDEVQKALGNLSGEGGRFFNLMEKQSATFSGMMSNLADAWTQFLRTSGAPVMEMLKGVLKVLLEFVNVGLPAIIQKMQEWAAYLKENPALIYGIAAAITAMLVPSLIAAAVAAAPMLLAFAQLILVGTAVGAAVYALKTAWDENFLGIRDITMQVWEYLKKAFDTFEKEWLPQITETLKNIAIIFREVWNGIWQFLKPLVMDIVNFFRNNWDTIKSIISAAWDIIGAVVKQAWNTVYSIVKLGMQLLTGDWKGAWDTIKQYFKSTWDNMGQLLSAAWQLIKSIISLGISAVGLALQLGWDAIKGAVQAVWNTIVGVIQGAWGIIKAAVSDAINLVKSIIQGGLSATQGIVSGLLGGIQNSFSSAFNAAKNIVSGIMDGMKNIVQSAVNSILSIINGLKDAINGAVSWVNGKVQGIQNSVSNAYSTAKNGLSSAANFVSAPFRALGGPVQAGQPYTVGERGMEVFVPNTAGRIVSNSDLAKSGGGATVNLSFGNVTISNGMDWDSFQSQVKRIVYDETRKANLGLGF